MAERIEDTARADKVLQQLLAQLGPDDPLRPEVQRRLRREDGESAGE